MASGQGQGVVLGYLRYVLGFDSLAFQEGVGDAEKRLKAAQKSISKTADGFKNIGAKLSLAVTAPLAAFAAKSFSAATDAVELQSAFDQTFGKMAESMNKWAEQTGDAMGRSTQEMQKAANTFGIFFNTADPSKAAAMSQEFAKLAQDLGSFYNTDTETAIEKLRSGLSGESEPLRDFGVFLTEATVQAKAMEMGLTGVGNELTEQEKILARYQLILEATKNAQGDVARTSDGTANQMRAAQAAFEELQVTVGTKLLPVLTPLITKLAEALNWFTTLPQPVQNTALAVGAIAAVVGPIALGIGGIMSGFAALLPILTTIAGFVVASLIPALASIAVALSPILIPLAAVAAAVGAVYYVWKNWDTIGPILARLYNGVKTWLVDKLGRVWDWLQGKIKAVGQWFFELYDAVVGHSYVPDMVDEIGENMARLQKLMVDPARSTTQSTGDQFSAMAQRIGGILDELFPKAAALREELAKLAALEADTTLSPELRTIAISRQSARVNDARQAATDEMFPQLQQVPGALDEAWEAVKATTADAASRIAVSTAAAGEAFVDMANKSLNALSNLASAIKGGGVLDILSSAFNAFGAIAGTGVLGKGLGNSFKNFTPISGFRANGGPVSGGKSYIVGERGPELFTASRSGYIHPNGTNDNGGRSRFEIVPSPYFDVIVEQRAAGIAAPMAVASGVQARSAAGADAARSARRRIPGR
ncbi:phage tail tape measure protein [Sphingobium sp. TomMM35A]